MKQDKIKVGQILSGFGIKGEIKLRPYTDFPEKRFAKGNTLNLSSGLTLKVRSFRVHQKWILIAFEGYPDLTSVEPLFGLDVLVDVECIDVSDGVYFFELKDAKVYREDQQYLGVITEVLDYPAHPVIRVVGDQEFLLPYVDRFIVHFDKQKKILVVRWMEGL
jgi:16S rRNA processing protein RimM